MQITYNTELVQWVMEQQSFLPIRSVDRSKKCKKRVKWSERAGVM